jgi:hypothetical protein
VNKKDELIGKKRLKSPKMKKKKISTRPKKKVKLDDSDFGKYEVLKVHPEQEDKLVTSREQIHQTRESCVEERFQLIHDNNETVGSGDIDLSITVAFSNDSYRSKKENLFTLF